jgi:hypothetical protein
MIKSFGFGGCEKNWSAVIERKDALCYKSHSCSRKELLLCPNFTVFFATTRPSVFEIFDGNDGTSPSIKVLATCSKRGLRVSEQMFGGSCIAVAGMHGVVLYSPNPDAEGREPENRPEVSWDCRTAAIVGLFLEEERAMECFRTPDLQHDDPRFREESAQVLAAIGDDHPVFVISGLHYASNPITA